VGGVKEAVSGAVDTVRDALVGTSRQTKKAARRAR
jgi:hypothetical protein